MQCRECDWYDDECESNHGEPLEDGWGRCRRHPPTCHAESSEVTDYFHTLWPIVEGVDWCGEFDQAMRDL